MNYAERMYRGFIKPDGETKAELYKQRLNICFCFIMILWHGFIIIMLIKPFTMKNISGKILKPVSAIVIAAIMLCSCTATVKVPKHPAPGEPPPPPPKVEIHDN